MNKSLISLLVAGAAAMAATAAQAELYTFKPVDNSGNKYDMMDLEHGYYYGWSIADSFAAKLGAELRGGSLIKSATLSFKNIYNWTYEDNDQLNSFLLAAPSPTPGKSETVPVVINGVTQGHTVYTYEKVTVSTKTNTTGVVPSGYKLTSTKKTCSTPTKCTTTYTYTKTTKTTTTNITGVTPSGYTKVSDKFIADQVTLGAGITLSSNLWERADQESRTDVDWGVESYRIQDINNDPANPWHDVTGGQKKIWDLTYQFDEGSLNALYGYALDGSFGVGIDPDCHYFNDGITLTIETFRPVPEPETYAMLLAGLGMLGAVARRRRTR